METGARGGMSYRWLMGVVLVAVGVYGWYAVTQYDRLNDLNQRELANAAAELKRAIENAYSAVERAAGRKLSLCDFDADQPYLQLDVACPEGKGTFGSVKLEGTPRLAITAAYTPEAGNSRDVRFLFRTDVFLQELSFPETFALILVAGRDGDVHYQDAPAARRWYRFLRWDEQEFRSAGVSGSGQVENLKSALGGEAVWSGLQAASSRSTLRLGGARQQLYLQPLALENGHQIDLVVGGAVPSDALIRQALAIDTYFLAGLVCLGLLAVLGYPFVKLASLDWHERFRLRDIVALHLSTAALLALGAFVVLGADGYLRWRGVADRGLEDLAASLERSLLDELEAVRDRVAAYDGALAEYGLSDRRVAHHRTCLEKIDMVTSWFTPPVSAGDVSGLRAGVQAPSDLRIDQVTWIKPTGMQAWKVTVDKGSGRIDVSKRSYFRAVRDGHLFVVRQRGRPFFVGPDRSITDGRFYTFVAMPSALPADFCAPAVGAPGGGTVVASVRLLSLDRVPLPAGYGFAILSREGRVLFHSDPRLALRENFFDELSAGATIKAQMYAGGSDEVSSRYRERPHRVRIQPLNIQRMGDGSPAGFYLSTFRDTSVEQSAVARVFIAGLAGPMALVVLLVALAMAAMSLVARWIDGQWHAWLWPHEALTPTYRRISIALTGLLIAEVVGVHRGVGEGAVALLPVAAAVVSITIYALGPRPHDSRRPLRSRGWHCRAVVLAMVCMVLGPSWALCRRALGREFGKLVSMEQQWVGGQRRDATRAIGAEARSDGYPSDMGEAWSAARNRYIAPAPAPFDATLAPIGMSPVAAGLNWIDDALPLQGDLSARYRFDTSTAEYSPDGTVWRRIHVSATGFLGMSALILVLVSWARWSATRLGLADLPSPPQDGKGIEDVEAAWQRLDEGDQSVLLQIVGESALNPRQRPAARRLIEAGFLDLRPHPVPATPSIARVLSVKQRECAAQVRAWEHASGLHSWRYVRIVLVGALIGLGFFLVATQPGMQSGILGIATALSGVLTSLLKLRDAAASWLPARREG